MVDIISCVFTVIALAFTLYLWLLDHLSEDESKFIENKAKILDALKASLSDILSREEREQLRASIPVPETAGSESLNAKMLLTAVQKVNDQLEVVLNYRFWARSRQRAEYEQIRAFYRDSRYLVSMLRRYEESGTLESARDSLISINAMDGELLEDIRTDYRDGLAFIVEFIENWE